MPQPGEVAATQPDIETPPQAGSEGCATCRVFMPHLERHTTRENIQNFFDPERYAQKRPLSSPTTAPTPAVKARVDKHELMEKFKLAAALNGFSLEDLFVSRQHA